ncbi:hypothetical protein [Amorphus orientalis]|uniref:HTH psq-type domain-containing protein n=1 Tax=Amorphus orientalis TaxID=649198 RepID=A0AAE3VU17_9HYPH|nr:hypothetical protein [Amorphus orientalis]MDQ0317845.1 hypothetical protein [Amorphus orientalis]
MTETHRFVPDWAAIRVAFEAGEWSQRKIAESYGVSESGLRTRADREGWDRSRRPKLGPAAAKRARPMPAGPNPTTRKVGRPAGRTPGERAAMVGRLYRVFEARIAALEARFDPEATIDTERDTKVLAALARTLDTLIALDRKARSEGAEAPAGENDDIDALRQDLARRLDRLAGRPDGG